MADIESQVKELGCGISDEEINSHANLMLVCHACHRTIDQDEAGVKYTPELLRRWKADHERRVELATAIDPNKKSHVVLYGANVGDQSSPLSYGSTAGALLYDRYPADDRAIELGMINSSWRDDDPDFWRAEQQHLYRLYEQRIAERLDSREIEHISLFAFAPQPLLVFLGTLLTDIPACEVFQLLKEPKGWHWQAHEHPLGLTLQRPASLTGPPALVLALSGTIVDERIRVAMNNDVSIWRVTVPRPHNDLLRSREQLAEFRQFIRPAMDDIKATHGQTALLHIFPATPIAVAVELGRIRQPKADLRWRVYDQVNKLGGFVPAIDIPKEMRNVWTA